MTVGELKSALEGVPNWLPVIVEGTNGKIEETKYANSVESAGFDVFEQTFMGFFD